MNYQLQFEVLCSVPVKIILYKLIVNNHSSITIHICDPTMVIRIKILRQIIPEKISSDYNITHKVTTRR